MDGMTTQQRYDEICKLSGMSEAIVRRVLNAEKQSIINSLKRGERSTLIGRCVIRPEIKNKIKTGGELTNYIKLSIEVASSLKSNLDGMEEFEKSECITEQHSGIRLNQIPSLV